MEAALQQIAQAQKFLLFDELIGEKADQQLRSVAADEYFFKRQVRNERRPWKIGEEIASP